MESKRGKFKLQRMSRTESLPEDSFEPLECELIFLVKLHPELYDTSHPRFGHLKTKLAAWDEIAKELQRKREWCALKWGSLRDCYEERKRMSEKGTEWPYDSAMSFLDPFIVDSPPKRKVLVSSAEPVAGPSGSQPTIPKITITRVGYKKVSSPSRPPSPAQASSSSSSMEQPKAEKSMDQGRSVPSASTFVAAEGNLTRPVKQSPELSDTSHESAHDPGTIRKLSLKKIANEFDKPKQWCMRKFKTIQYYCTEQKRLFEKGVETLHENAVAFLDGFKPEGSLPPVPAIVITGPSESEEIGASSRSASGFHNAGNDFPICESERKGDLLSPRASTESKLRKQSLETIDENAE